MTVTVMITRKTVITSGYLRNVRWRTDVQLNSSDAAHIPLFFKKRADHAIQIRDRLLRDQHPRRKLGRVRHAYPEGCLGFWFMPDAQSIQMPAMRRTRQHGSAFSHGCSMKRLLIATAFVVSAPLNTTAQAADTGLSVSTSQPSFFGRLDIGDYPPPQVIYPQPVAVEPVPNDRPPIYLRVPPAHAKHWRKHCRQYQACGERVYFVHDKWYSREHVSRSQKQPKAAQVTSRINPRVTTQKARRDSDHARSQDH